VDGERRRRGADGEPGADVPLSEEDARHVRKLTEQTGTFVLGRKLFDVTSGWGGRHALDKLSVEAGNDVTHLRYRVRYTD
jgi:hypothetical protein